MTTNTLEPPEPREAAASGENAVAPMAPEEMVDVKDMALQVDEAMVKRLIAEAKADYAVNLMSPFHANQHANEVIRHRRRLLKVLGSASRAKSNGKNVFTVALCFGLVFAGLWYNEQMPVLADFIFAAIFATAIGALLYYFGAYGEAFAKAYALERRDFTDPGYVTGLCRTYLPRLTMYERPEVWRGNNGHNGIRSKDSFIVVACGLDTIRWTYDENNPDWDADQWCEVTPGKRIQDFRTPADYYDLPADTFMTDAISMKHRRAWARDLQQSGQAYAAWAKGGMSIMDGKWVWLAGGALMAVGLFLVIMAMG